MVSPDVIQTWRDKKAIVLQLQKETTRAYISYLEVKKSMSILQKRAPDFTQVEAIDAAIFSVFDRYYRIYIAACNDANDFREARNIDRVEEITPFDFHSIVV